MNYGPNNPVPKSLYGKIAEMLPRSTGEEVAAAIGCHSATVIRIARKMGVPIRRRGCNLAPTCKHVHNAYKLRWPAQPKGQAPLNWA